MSKKLAGEIRIVRKKQNKPPGVATNRPKLVVQRPLGKGHINSYDKGKRGQIQARNLWRQIKGFEDTQSQTQDQARRGAKPPDLTGSLQDKFYVEVKFTAQKITQGLLQKWWSKLMDDRYLYSGYTIQPILMYRRNREKWRILRCPCNGEFVYESWEEFRHYLRATVQRGSYD